MDEVAAVDDIVQGRSEALDDGDDLSLHGLVAAPARGPDQKVRFGLLTGAVQVRRRCFRHQVMGWTPPLT